MAFMTGAFFGTVLSYLAFTDKGKEVREDIKMRGIQVFEDGRAALLRKLDKIEESLEGDFSDGWESEEDPGCCHGQDSQENGEQDD